MNKIISVLVIVCQIYIASAQKDNTILQKAAVAYSNGEWQQAEGYYFQALSSAPSNYEIYIKLGDCQIKRDKTQDAIENYQKANDLRYNSANYKLSVAYALSGDLQKSLFFLENYLNETEKITEHEIQENPAFAKWLQTPEWKKLWTNQWYSKYELSLIDAKYFISKGQYIDAFDILDKLLYKNKKRHKVYILRAEIYMKTADYGGAIRNYSKAIEYKKNNSEYYQLRAQAHLHAEKYHKAVQDLDMAIELNPTNITLFFQRSIAENLAKKYDAAQSDISFFLGFYPNNEQAIYHAGIVYYNLKDYIESLKFLNQVLKINPKKSDYYLARANTLLATESYMLAINDYAAALDLNPSLNQIYYNRGIARNAINDTQGACKDWESAKKNGDYRANNYLIKYCKY